jgi:hypothetical protein
MKGASRIKYKIATIRKFKIRNMAAMIAFRLNNIPTAETMATSARIINKTRVGVIISSPFAGVWLRA